MSMIGDVVICNTGRIIGYECVLCDYCHIALGAILFGNVNLGEKSFIGTGSVMKKGIIIGKNVIIGDGTIVIRDVEDGKTIVGNPQKVLK